MNSSSARTSLARFLSAARHFGCLPAICLALAAVAPAHAQTRTWSGASSSSWNATGNWSGSNVPNTTAETAAFGTAASNRRSLTFSANSDFDLGGITFNSGADAFTITLNASSTFRLNGAGIVNNSSNTQTFTNRGLIEFYHSASAGSATFMISGADGDYVATDFYDTATAGSAHLTLGANGQANFNNQASAGSAFITASDPSILLNFNDSATAGSATITAAGNVNFTGNASAGTATVTMNSSYSSLVYFDNDSTAASAHFTLNDSVLYFTGNATAANATISLDATSAAYFDGNSTGGAAAFTLQAGASIDVSASSASGLSLGSIAGNGTVYLGANQLKIGGDGTSTTFRGQIYDAGGASNVTGGSLVKTGAGTFTFTGTNPAGVPLEVQGGTVIFSPSALAAYSGTVIANTDGTVIVAPSDPSQFTGVLAVQPGGNLTISLPNSTPLAAASIFFNNGGTLTLDGHASTALSATRLDLNSGATLDVPDGTVFGSLIGGNTTLRTNSQYGPGISVGANNSDSYLNGTFSVQNSYPSGSTSLQIVKTGTGTLFLGDAFNSFVEVQAGYVQPSSGSAVGLQGGGLRYASDMTHNGTIYVETSGVIDTGSHAVTYSGGLDSNPNTTLTKIGSGTLTITGTNHLSGTLALNGGALSVSASDKLGWDYPQYDVVSTLTFGGGTLQTTASFTSTHPVTLNSGGGTIDVASATTLTWNGNLAGASNNPLTKTSAGTLVLGGTNTYTGATAINAGTLVVNGSLANTAVTISNGATLGGSGTIGGLTTLNSGSHLAPGNSPGTLTFSHGLTLNDGSVLDFQLGSSSDLIDVTGGDLTGPFTGTITVNLEDSGDFSAGSYDLIHYVTLADGSATAANFSLGTSIPGYSYRFNLTATALQLIAAPIPEPTTTAALFALVALAGAVLHRRRGIG